MANASSDKDRTAEVVNDLIRAHGQQLEHLVARIVRDVGVAQQILQDTYLSLYTRLMNESAAPVKNAKAYLFGAATTKALEHQRGESRQKRGGKEGKVVDEEATNLLLDRRPGPAKAATLQHAIQQLSDLVDELPRKQRSVFVLGKVQGFPYREIAAELGVREKAVEGLMTRALGTLRAGLVERGIESMLDLDDDIVGQ